MVVGPTHGAGRYAEALPFGLSYGAPLAPGHGTPGKAVTRSRSRPCPPASLGRTSRCSSRRRRGRRRCQHPPPSRKSTDQLHRTSNSSCLSATALLSYVVCSGQVAGSQYGGVTLVVLKEGDPRHAYVNFATSQQAAAAAAAGDIVLLGQPANVPRSLWRTAYWNTNIAPTKQNTHTHNPVTDSIVFLFPLLLNATSGGRPAVLSKRRKPPTMEGEPTDGVGIFNMPFTMAGPPTRRQQL